MLSLKAHFGLHLYAAGVLEHFVLPGSAFLITGATDHGPGSRGDVWHHPVRNRVGRMRGREVIGSGVGVRGGGGRGRSDL